MMKISILLLLLVVCHSYRKYHTHFNMKVRKSRSRKTRLRTRKEEAKKEEAKKQDYSLLVDSL